MTGCVWLLCVDVELYNALNGLARFVAHSPPRLGVPWYVIMRGLLCLQAGSAQGEVNVSCP